MIYYGTTLTRNKQLEKLSKKSMVRKKIKTLRLHTRKEEILFIIIDLGLYYRRE